MMSFFKLILTILLLFCFSYAKAQGYCIQFSKEKKKTVMIEDGKKISFVILYNEDWEKGIITKITPDSLFIKQPIAKKDILKERESNFEELSSSYIS